MPCVHCGTTVQAGRYCVGCGRTVLPTQRTAGRRPSAGVDEATQPVLRLERRTRPVVPAR